MIVLWNDVKSVCEVNYLCTRQLNQDPLENCFSFIRSEGGFCANPDPKQFVNRTLTHFFLRCLAHPVSNVQMILLSLPLMMSWVPLNWQPLTSIRYPNKMLCFMLEGTFARNILRNTVAKSVLRHCHGLN